MQQGRTDNRLLGATIWGAIAIGLALRVASSFQSFWLDEIWSYNLAQDLGSAWDVVAHRKHDNNHILNTLFIHWVGEREHWFWYRLLSILTGTASLYLLARAARERGALEAATVAVLAALSYPLTVASAQARGYAPAIFFSLLAFRLIQAYWDDRSARTLALFWLTCALGILSHLTFLYTYLALLAWSLLREPGHLGGSRATVAELAKCHCVPAAVIGALYAVFYSEIIIGGGPSDYDVLAVVRQTISGAMAIPTGGALANLATAAAIAIFLSGIVLLRREGSDQWIFYLFVLLLAPAIVFMASIPRLFYPRYLLASVPFFYLLGAVVLSAIYRRSRLGRVAYAALLLAFAIGSGSNIAALLETGRTNYSDAVTYLEENSDGDFIRIGSDHDFRNRMVLKFYSRDRSSDRRILYRERDLWAGVGPEWYLVHSWLSSRPPRQLTLDGDRHFTLVKIFPHGTGYGWTWFLYRNDANPTEPAVGDS